MSGLYTHATKKERINQISMKTVKIQNRTFTVHDRLVDFNVNMPISKGVAFYGTNPASGSLFIQFANGGTYIYANMTGEIRRGLHNATSIGRYVAEKIVGKFPSEKLSSKGISPMPA